MAASLFDPHYQAIDSAGAPYSGAKLYFYQTGTTTPITVYQDSALSTPHASPVVADSAGRFSPIYVSTAFASFKTILKTSADVTVQTVDPHYTRFNTGITDDLSGKVTVGGTANAITVTTATVYTALTSGIRILFKPTADNSGATTFNLDGLGVKAIRRMSGGTDVALTGAEILNGQRVEVVYDSSANAAAGAWIILNPAGSSSYLPLAGGTMTGNLIISKADPTFTLIGTGNAGLEIGRQDGTTSTPFIDFHSGATAVDYDVRMIVSGGTGATGGGTLTFTAASVVASGSLTLGTALTAGNGGTGLTSPGTSGNVLTSNGSAWVSSAPTAGMTLLGTITTTSGTSQSLSGLTLTNYKQLILVFNAVSGTSGALNLTMNTRQISPANSSGADTWVGHMFIDLATGVGTSMVANTTSGNTGTGTAFYVLATGLSTASTSVTVAISGNPFDAGSIRVYAQ